MTNRLRPADLAHAPAAMREPHAAAYVGLSVTTFRGLEDGPPARRVRGCVLYLRADLDAWAASLPIEGERAEDEGRKAADDAFS